MASRTIAAPGATLDWLRRGQDLILPLSIIASVLVILVPLPPALLDVLLSGNHAMIERWRREESERITRERRPDLLTSGRD